MALKRRLKKIAEKLTGTHIFLRMPFGVSVAHDISLRFPGYRLDVIFDVGANVGQSALRYASTYPASTIYCFEPVKETFDQLTRNVAGKKQITCCNVALSDYVGDGTMISNGTSVMNRLVDEDGMAGVTSEQREQVHVSTVDTFCESSNIARISYLKVDAEGGDLDVLAGSRGILQRHGVDMVEVEAGMNPGNKRHVPLESLKGFLEGLGVFVFGIYAQVSELQRKEPHLRRANAVFISEAMIRDSSEK